MGAFNDTPLFVGSSSRAQQAALIPIAVQVSGFDIAKLAAALESVPQHVLLGVHPSLVGEDSARAAAHAPSNAPTSSETQHHIGSDHGGAEEAVAAAAGTRTAVLSAQREGGGADREPAHAGAGVHSGFGAAVTATDSGARTSEGARGGADDVRAAGGDESKAQQELEASLDALLSLGTAAAEPSAESGASLQPLQRRSEPDDAQRTALRPQPAAAQIRPPPKSAQPGGVQMGAAELEDWLDL